MYLLDRNVKIIKWRAHVPHSGNFIHFLYTCVFFGSCCRCRYSIAAALSVVVVLVVDVAVAVASVRCPFFSVFTGEEKHSFVLLFQHLATDFSSTYCSCLTTSQKYRRPMYCVKGSIYLGKRLISASQPAIARERKGKVGKSKRKKWTTVWIHENYYNHAIWSISKVPVYFAMATAFPPISLSLFLSKPSRCWLFTEIPNEIFSHFKTVFVYSRIFETIFLLWYIFYDFEIAIGCYNLRSVLGWFYDCVPCLAKQSRQSTYIFFLKFSFEIMLFIFPSFWRQSRMPIPKRKCSTLTKFYFIWIHSFNLHALETNSCIFKVYLNSLKFLTRTSALRIFSRVHEIQFAKLYFQCKNNSFNKFKLSRKSRKLNAWPLHSFSHIEFRHFNYISWLATWFSCFFPSDLLKYCDLFSR